HDSEVTDSTTDLLLEVANFDPSRIRVTRRALGLSTDASYRFERGVDGMAVVPLLELAAGLMVNIAGGEVDSAPLFVGREPTRQAPVDLRPARAEQMLGDGVP